MIAVSYHDKVNVLQGIRLASAGPFDRAEWFAMLAQYGDSRPLIALASDGAAVLALPLSQANHRLEPLLNWYSFTWRPLASEGAAAPALAAALARDLRKRARRVTLWPLPDEDGSASLLEQAFRTAGWRVTRQRCDSNHILPVRGRSFAEYLASCPGPLRTTLKRRSRYVDISIIKYFDNDAWETYDEIYAGSWKPTEGSPALLRAFAEAEGLAGRLRFGIARHEGRPVAAQFWTVEGGTAWIHKLAHRDDARHLSAGTSLTAALFEHVIDRDRVALVDFGTGDDPYKRDWMEEVRPRYRLDCHDPTDLRSWPHIARAAVQRLVSGGEHG